MKNNKRKIWNIAIAALITFSAIGLGGCSNDGSTAKTEDKTDTTVATDPTALTQSCTAAGATITGTQSGCVEVAADSTVTLSGTVKFPSGSALKINEGATLKAETGGVFTYVIIDRGAAIVAIGTEAKPITFTSDKTAGSRARQDWGGIIINGKAQVNVSSPSGEGNSGTYGGSVDADNSGTLKYVRIMFAGKDFQTTDELNGLALQGVGSGTTIDYVQFHNNLDDGIEMFGGNVNLKHIVSTANGDDGIDCTYGWRGKVQWAIALALESKPSNDDPAGALGSPNSGKIGNRALEHDNNGSDNAATPLGSVTYSNLTAVNMDNSADLMRIREGALDVKFYNSYFAHNDIDGDSTFDYDCVDTRDNATAKFYNSLLEGCELKTKDGGTNTVDGTSANVGTGTAPDYIALVDGGDADAGGNAFTLTELASTKTAAFVPNAANNNGVSAKGDMNTTIDSFFANTNYVGAIESAGSNWADVWTEFPAN